MKRYLLILATLPLFAQILGPGTITATVVTAGTPVQLSTANLMVKSFAVQLESGSATFCVGASTVSASAGKGTCLTGTTQNIEYKPLAAGESYDLSRYYVDASSSSTIVAINYNVQN